MNKPLWSPTVQNDNRILVLQQNLHLNSYWELQKWSVENPGDFWSLAWDDMDVLGRKGNEYFNPGSDFISSRFFPDATLNVAENLLARGLDNDPAIIEILETGARHELTWKELRERVAATAAAMRSEGVAKGDRVAAWSSNVSEVVIWGLAALSIGAIVSTASPDFAPNAVEDRFGQIEPKLLLVADEYFYAGKHFVLDSKISEIEKLLPTVKKVIRRSEFSAFIKPFAGSALTFEQLPFDHPGFVLFSSGTTGKPKCIVHSAAGVFLKVSAELFYQFDIKDKERVFFFTTCGWMMWNWLFMTLGRGATIILYDGSPAYPETDQLFRIAANEKVEFLGLSAKYVDSCRKADVAPINNLDLENLRMIGSTGSVLSPESFDYIYENVKHDVHLASMSGGTDICGCFVASVPTLPVYRGELQGPSLGMDADIFDENGAPAAIDMKGELVCKTPFPSKPLGFWGDVDNQKYRVAYFEGFPGVWTHGDFASRSETGGYTIYGRSDATLNSRGIRIGTAEIYRIVETFPEIQESLAVAQDWDGDTRIVLFVVLKAGAIFTEENEKAIKRALREQASPRHVPDKMIVAPQLPRTKSNKLVELAVADIINGRTVRNRDALANPEALDWFTNLEALRS